MKDSQHTFVLDAFEDKYIKANNERFSTTNAGITIGN